LIQRKGSRLWCFDNRSTDHSEADKETTVELATQTHLKNLRDLLTYRRVELRAEVHAAEQVEHDDAAEAGAHEVSDRKDESARWQAGELRDAQEQRNLAELGDVEDALQRLDAGIYGDCADCSEPIAAQRLMVQPAARRCAACQAAHEAAAHAARAAT